MMNSGAFEELEMELAAGFDRIEPSRTSFLDALKKGTLSRRQIVRGLDAMREAAMRGCEESAYTVGALLAHPDVLGAVDVRGALYWLRKAARGGHPNACQYAAILYADEFLRGTEPGTDAARTALGWLGWALEYDPGTRTHDMLGELVFRILDEVPELREEAPLARRDVMTGENMTVH